MGMYVVKCLDDEFRLKGPSRLMTCKSAMLGADTGQPSDLSCTRSSSIGPTILFESLVDWSIFSSVVLILNEIPRFVTTGICSQDEALIEEFLYFSARL